MKHYPYQEDTWRWGIPERKRGQWNWRVFFVGLCLTAAALILAVLVGCSRKPLPNVKGLINGKEVSCYSNYNGGFTCHDPDPETVVARQSTTVELEPQDKAFTAKNGPTIKVSYPGGAWCNVWADAEGIHWEACK